jgi:regulator of protease activity HflC (stomatin/prohibitin superfamily)
MKPVVLAPPGASPPTRWQRFTERRLPNILIFLMVATFVIAMLFPYMVITVPSGYVGVLWKRFGGLGIYCWCMVGRGTVLDPREIRGEGLHIIWPWDKLFLYNLRLQTASQTYNAISKDGVSVSATINVRFQLKHNSVAQLHKFIGPGYVETVVLPEIGSQARLVIANFTAEEVYSTSRQEIQEQIRSSGERKLGEKLDRLVQPEASCDQFAQTDNSACEGRVAPRSERFVTPDLKNSIDILDTLVLGIDLPGSVVNAINNKAEQLYVAQEYQFRVEREQKESERKRIEAAGIHDFQQIVSQGISDSYLRWRGIEATLQLALSNNTKIVMVGGGKDGLPIILGNVDSTPVSSNSPAAPVPGAMPNQTLLSAPPPAHTTPRASPAPVQNAPVAGGSTPLENDLTVTTTPKGPTSDRFQALIPLTWSDVEAIFSRLTENARSSSPKQQPDSAAAPR